MLSKSDYRYFKKAKMAATISDYKKTHIPSASGGLRLVKVS